MRAGLGARGSRALSGYDVRIEGSWTAGERSYRTALSEGDATLFQGGDVVSSWYLALSDCTDVEPLLVSVRERETGARVLELPLIRGRRGPVRIIGFADLDLIDYNAPVLGPAAPRTAEDARAVWRAIVRALPPSDLIHLRKMPLRIEQRANPLALLHTLPCELNGNLVETGDSFDAYMRGVLRRVVRKELERSWRVFTRHPGAQFRVATEAGERARVLAAIEAQQPIRMGLSGKAYQLDAPHAAEFYRRLVASDPTGARVILLSLTAGEEIVAALIGLRGRASFTMIRISSSVDDAWTNCSPGRLVIWRTMAHLHGEGVRTFDFSVGNYDYKRRFGVVPSPLVDLVRPLTPLGLAGAGRAYALAWLGRRPDLEARLRRLLGRARATQG